MASAGHWRGQPDLTGGGPAGWARGPRGPQAPAGGVEHQMGLPTTWPSQPSRGGGAGRESARPPSHGGAGPCGQAARQAHTAPPHARPRGRLRRLQRKGSAEPPTPLPRKADSRHPRPATRPPPGGAPAPAGTAKAPLSPSAGVRIRRPQAESMPCEPAPRQRCLRTRAAYLTQGRGLVENSSCPGGAVKPPPREKQDKVTDH